MSRTLDELVTGTMTCTDTAAVITNMPGGVFDVLIQADPDNGGTDVYLGNSTSQPIRLQAGDKFSWGINAPQNLYVKTASGTALIRWMVRK